MKVNFIRITLMFIALFSFGSLKAETILTNVYAILSDEFSKDIPEGTCLVNGKVYEGYSEEPVKVGYIGEVSQTRYTSVQSDGTYSLNLTDEDSTLYFYHPLYGEIVCWNYDFKSQHIVTIDFITSSNEPNGMQIMEEKPVIYLYNEEPLTADLNLTPRGEFTFTYPEYNSGWSVELGKEGNMMVDGKNYPYLFWEAKTSDLNFVSKDKGVEGYFIKTDSCIQFLETVLIDLGLNPKEQTDFITYWGPRLIQKPYAIVQFLVDEDYNKHIADLQVSPLPDSQRRIYMLFEGVENKLEPNFLVTPKYPAFSRKGFVLTEWGGSELN